MRTVQVQSFEPQVLRVDEVEPPVPGENDVVVDVVAIGVSFADTLVVAGKYQALPPLPFAPGMEFSGTVRDVGSAVGTWRPGDRVVGYITHGAYSEQVMTKEHDLFAVPEDVPLVDAATLSMPFLTAYLAIRECGFLQPGQTVLVGGANGAVGHAAVQLIAAMGGHALACTRAPDTSDALIKAGASGVIDISEGDLRTRLIAQVMDITEGRGVDIVLDPVGGEFFDAAMRVTAWRGHMVVIGFAGGGIPQVRANQLLLRTISVGGMNLTSFRDHAPDLLRHGQADIFRLWREGRIRSDIVRQYPLAEASVALDFVAGGRNDGRAVLLPGGSAT